MFLKSLSLKGFKSFADTTVMYLEPGVTVVVGPNGSGKSNVVDAIAWVLGAQAPSAVRSQKMDDVIFAGTATRPALGRAEVSLTIDNSAGLLGLELTEITLSRILFRTGESEYSINGVPCRLLDVQELLSDAGVGRQQHVIVSQGQIDAVLNARPEDRRGIVEEAAGVLKFRKRKEKAERRLASTEASLLRLNDLIREVRRQLKPLERQAEAARRHGDLIDELTALRVHVAGRQLSRFRTALAGHTATREQRQRDEAHLRAILVRLDSEVLTLEAEVSVRDTSDLSDRLIRVEQLRGRARGVLALIAERRRGVERDSDRMLDEGLIATLEHDLTEMRIEIATVASRLDQMAPEREQLSIDEAMFANERQGLFVALDADPSAAVSKAASEMRGELRSLRTGFVRVEADHRRAAERHDQLAASVVDLRVELERRRQELETIEADQPRLEAELDEAGAALGVAEMAEAVAAGERDDATTAAARWLARIEALQLAIDVARSPTGAESLAGVDDVLGALLDLVEIDQGWELAARAALGDAFEAMVVGGDDVARAAAMALRAANACGTVISLDAAMMPRPPAELPGRPVRPRVRRRSGVPEGIDRLLDRLLAGAVRVDAFDAALDAASTDPELLVVTESGDRFGDTGWRIGADGSSAVTAAALEEATTESATAVARRSTASAAAEEALIALDGAREAQRLAQQAVDRHHATRTLAADAVDRARRQLREIDTRLRTLGQEFSQSEQHLASERARITELEATIPGLEADEASAADTARQRSDHIAALDARAAVLSSRRRDLDVRAAALRERHDALAQRITETEQRLDADATARSEVGERRQQLARTLHVLDQMHQRVEQHRQSLDADYTALTERRQRMNDQVRQLIARLDDCRKDRGDAEIELETVRERTRRSELDEAETRLRLEALVETLRRELSIEPETAEQAPMPELPDGISAAAQLRQLERELRLLGPINPLALEEFNELRERHSFLEAQLDDVRSTRRELNRVISAIDNEIQSVFAAAFSDVSANFAALFATLFPGGMGKLVLTQPADMLGSGIEVEAKPSGKNVKKLSLLSGGERSLTALAFLFAVFRSRPSPFYVMDEVEAALDDVNLHRFLGLLAEFRGEAQLLIVTHQKRTMEAGDCLLGVSMQPGGSSKVIAERVTEPDDHPASTFA